VVDRMMELTQLEARRSLAQVEPVTLGPLVEEVVLAASHAAAPCKVTVVSELAAEVAVQGDRFLLRRALGNLVDNAIDFSPDGGTVTVALRRDGRMGVIEVRDEGPGVPEYARGKVYEKFYSLARPASGKKSTGLGLSFVRQIATLHHGRITLENAEQGGAVATLTLPAGESG
jgi:two-component system sensor histidine kinase CreC